MHSVCDRLAIQFPGNVLVCDLVMSNEDLMFASRLWFPTNTCRGFHERTHTGTRTCQPWHGLSGASISQCSFLPLVLTHTAVCVQLKDTTVSELPTAES